MKLRNKVTGEVWDIGKILTNDYPSYDRLNDITEDFEDIQQPLIKDEKIRKAVRAWADYHNITKVDCRIGDWDHAGMCIYDSVLQFYSSRDRIVIQFFKDANGENIKEGTYTIAELCGEEEE